VKKTDVEKMIFFRKKSDIPQKQERIARSGVSRVSGCTFSAL